MPKNAKRNAVLGGGGGANAPMWKFATPSPVKPVIDYDQGKDERLEKLPSLQGGACLALSIFWVRYSKDGIGLVQWLQPPKAACSKGIDRLSYEITHGGDGLQVIMNAQKKMGAGVLEGSGDIQTKNDVFQNQILNWASRQCIPNAGKLNFNKGVSIGTLAAFIAQRSGYCIFGFWIKGWGGHACAAYSTDRSVTYFDPNWGVFNLPKSQFVSWLSRTFTSKYAQIVDSGGVIDA